MIFHGREVDPIQLWSRYCDVKPAEGEFLGLVHCPHPDHENTRSPSFQINQRRPLVHCFNSQCGFHKGGTYERAIALLEGISPREAKRFILRNASMLTAVRGTGKRKHVPGKGRATESVSSSGVPEESQAIASCKAYDSNTYSFLPKEARAYLESRGIDSDSRARFGLGYDEDAERIVIPVRDEHRVLRFLIRRAVRPKQRPAYLYDEGYPKTALLFGACHIDVEEVRSTGLVLVEGSLDAIRFHQHGITNTVAVLGSSISHRQRKIIEKLRPKRVFLFFDCDAAGVGAIRSCESALNSFPLYVCRYPDNKFDPAELTGKEAHRSLERAISIMQFNLRTKPKRNRKKEEIGAKTYS